MPVPDEIVQLHLAELRELGRTPGTIAARRRAIARMSRLIKVPLTEATEADLARWRAGLRVTDNTVVHYACDARQFFAFLVRRGLRADNPAAGLRVPVLTRGKPRPISDADLMRALALAPPRIRPWLVLAACGGLRAKELALLKRQSVLDTATPPVLIVAKDATKGRRERIIPLSRFAVDELRRAGLPRAATDYVFPRLDGRTGPLSPGRVSQATNQFLHEIGITASLHQVRHWFGTTGWKEKRDLRLLQELMGHEDPATTAGYVGYCAIEAIELTDALSVRLAA